VEASTTHDKPGGALVPGLARVFPGTPESVSGVRAFVAEALPADPAAEDAVLMASELFFPGFRSVSAPCSGDRGWCCCSS
jgi:hypothetical protein